MQLLGGLKLVGMVISLPHRLFKARRNISLSRKLATSTLHIKLLRTKSVLDAIAAAFGQHNRKEFITYNAKQIKDLIEKNRNVIQ
eukprot:1156674-Pelagomonas_calceolata.AAC.1